MLADPSLRILIVFADLEAAEALVVVQFPDCRPVARYVYFQNSIRSSIVDEFAKSLGKRMG